MSLLANLATAIAGVDTQLQKEEQHYTALRAGLLKRRQALLDTRAIITPELERAVLALENVGINILRP